MGTDTRHVFVTDGLVFADLLCFQCIRPHFKLVLKAIIDNQSNRHFKHENGTQPTKNGRYDGFQDVGHEVIA